MPNIKFIGGLSAIYHVLYLVHDLTRVKSTFFKRLEPNTLIKKNLLSIILSVLLISAIAFIFINQVQANKNNSTSQANLQKLSKEYNKQSLSKDKSFKDSAQSYSTDIAALKSSASSQERALQDEIISLKESANSNSKLASNSSSSKPDSANPNSTSDSPAGKWNALDAKTRATLILEEVFLLQSQFNGGKDWIAYLHNDDQVTVVGNGNNVNLSWTFIETSIAATHDNYSLDCSISGDSISLKLKGNGVDPSRPIDSTIAISELLNNFYSTDEKISDTLNKTGLISSCSWN